MANGILQNKSFEFSMLIINTYKKIINEKKEYVLSRQLLRSGTSIGANIEEAFGGMSKKDFLSKIYISYKEARETKYWIRLLTKCDYIDSKTADDLMESVEELLCILIASIKKVKAGMDK